MRRHAPAPEAAVIPLSDADRAHLAELDELDPPEDPILELFARVEALEAEVAALRGGAPKASPLDDLAARLVDETFDE